MKVSSLEAIFRALQEAEARYIVVGGLAVVAHGYVRLIGDEILDLVLDLSSPSLSCTLTALESLGYHPPIPISFQFFADSELRRSWAENQNTTAFILVNERYPDVIINIFAKEPFAFDTEFARSDWKEVSFDIQIPVVSVPALIALKREANGNLDLTDIDKLQKLHFTPIVKVDEGSEPWPCDWDGHELQQLRRDASRSFREHLIWMEEMTEFAHRFAKAPWIKRANLPPKTGTA